jgi:hypothetical protein
MSDAVNIVCRYSLSFLCPICQYNNSVDRTLYLSPLVTRWPSVFVPSSIARSRCRTLDLSPLSLVKSCVIPSVGRSTLTRKDSSLPLRPFTGRCIYHNLSLVRDFRIRPSTSIVQFVGRPTHKYDYCTASESWWWSTREQLEWHRLIIVKNCDMRQPRLNGASRRLAASRLSARLGSKIIQEWSNE